MNYLIPKARNAATRQTVKTQNLYGTRFRLDQVKDCQKAADDLARKMSITTGQAWNGFVEEYTETKRLIKQRGR